MTLFELKEIPKVSRREILRYAGAREEGLYSDLLDECLKEAEKAVSYRLCYATFPLEREGDLIRVGNMSFRSRDLAKTLRDSHKVIVFAATLGVGLDRLINKYSKLQPSKALFLQAIGAERIEALCDAFCHSLGEKVTPRFSTGYGDLPLELQEGILEALDATKLIGITLTDSFMMSPTKSVTAFIGIKN